MATEQQQNCCGFLGYIKNFPLESSWLHQGGWKIIWNSAVVDCHTMRLDSVLCVQLCLQVCYTKSFVMSWNQGGSNLPFGTFQQTVSRSQRVGPVWSLGFPHLTQAASCWAFFILLIARQSMWDARYGYGHMTAFYWPCDHLLLV